MNQQQKGGNMPTKEKKIIRKLKGVAEDFAESAPNGPREGGAEPSEVDSKSSEEFEMIEHPVTNDSTHINADAFSYSSGQKGEFLPFFEQEIPLDSPRGSSRGRDAATPETRLQQQLYNIQQQPTPDNHDWVVVQPQPLNQPEQPLQRQSTTSQPQLPVQQQTPQLEPAQTENPISLLALLKKTRIAGENESVQRKPYFPHEAPPLKIGPKVDNTDFKKEDLYGTSPSKGTSLSNNPQFRNQQQQAPQGLSRRGNPVKKGYLQGYSLPSPSLNHIQSTSNQNNPPSRSSRPIPPNQDLSTIYQKGSEEAPYQPNASKTPSPTIMNLAPPLPPSLKKANLFLAQPKSPEQPSMNPASLPIGPASFATQSSAEQTTPSLSPPRIPTLHSPPKSEAGGFHTGGHYSLRAYSASKKQRYRY